MMKVQIAPLWFSQAFQADNFSINKVINSVVKPLFDGLKTVITFPRRYLGSKTWSVPGLIIKTPYYVFKKIFDPTISIKSELLGTGYHSRYQKELSSDEAKHFLPYISAAVFAFSSDPTWVEPFGYKVVSLDSLELGSTKYQILGNAIVDLESGFKMSMVEKEGELVIGFGGMGSLKNTLSEDPKKLQKISYQQHFSAVKNILGFKEDIYLSAELLINRILSQPQFEGKKVRFVGQCFGGSIAQYLALKLSHKAYCFNTLQLGAGLQELVPLENLKKADDFVTHVACKGDFINESILPEIVDFIWGSFGCKTPGNFGKRFSISTPYTIASEIHNYALGSFMNLLGFDKRTKPDEILDWISKNQFTPDSV